MEVKMEKITIGEVIAYVDAIKPNTRTPEEKKAWLNTVDQMFYDDVVLTHANTDELAFNGYTEDASDEQELLIPKPYGRDIYSLYISLQIDLVNQEWNKYNSSSALYNSAYSNYIGLYHRTHLPNKTTIKM